MGTESTPIWLVVMACGTAAQFVKLGLYSVANRRFMPAVVAQGYGLPSLPASSLACLTAMAIVREGWGSGAATFAAVFSVIAVHDILKLRTAATEQREVVYRLVNRLPDAGPLQQQVAGYLDPLSHHPAHVALGVAFGALFALAFGQMPR